jgi:PAS domain S-box-containing protein
MFSLVFSPDSASRHDGPSPDARANTESRRAAGPSSGRVWVIDDSPLEARRTREVLADTYAVDVFTDAASLLESLAHGQALPHLVLLDWYMPGVSGLETLTFLRERYDEVTLPVLVLTASRREEDLEAALTAGANDFVPKPFNDAELRARVRTLVRVRMLADSLRQREAEAQAARGDAQAARTLSENALGDVQDATEALHESEERLRRLSETGIVGILEWDVSGALTRANDTFLHMVGYSREDLEAGRLDFRALTPPEYQEATARAVRTLKETGILPLFEKQYFRKDGTRVDVLIGSATLDAERTRGIGLVLDITERKALEAALRESEERLRLTLAGTGMGTFEADVATGAVTFDARMREVCNILSDEPLSRERAIAQVHPADRERVEEVFYRALEQGVSYRLEHRVMPLPGQQCERWVAASGAAIRGADGRVARVVGTGLDITEQVEARKHLEESEARFRLIANALPMIVWTATSEFVVDWYNDWWFQYLGLPRGTRWDDPDTLPMHPEDIERTRPRLREAVETGKDFLMEQRFRRGSDGQYRWHLVRGVPIRDPDGRIVKWVGANTDIHDQKTVTASLEEERELREKFVATLSHDLRTPLTAARLNAQLLARKGSDPTVLYRSAARITETLDRADQMIRDMLDANRIRAGQGLPIEVSECDLTPLARETVDELSLVHGDRFVLNAPAALPGHWSCSGMRRIIENLCNNAIKYGARERPVTITLAELGPDEVSVSVHNWGQPIPPEDLKHLFQQYRRADSALAGPHKGWGLGLTVVEGLAMAHQGAVRVESTQETGTTFTVTVARNLRH